MEAPPSPSHVVIAYDATKDRSEHELELTVHGLRMRGDILRPGDTLLVLAVLHKVPHPSKCSTNCFLPYSHNPMLNYHKDEVGMSC